MQANTSGAAPAGFERSPEDRKRILRERARLLARPVVREQVYEAEIEIVQFSVGSSEFAVECGGVRESSAVREITPLPCAPAHVVGIVNIRGEIVPVLDLGEVFGREGISGAGDRILVVDSPLGPVSFLIDAVGEVNKAPGALTAPAEPVPYSRGLLMDRVTLLDIEALVAGTYMPLEADVELVEE